MTSRSTEEIRAEQDLQKAAEKKTLGAIEAVRKLIDGKTVTAQEFDTTDDEIFVVFKAKIAQITQDYKNNRTPQGAEVLFNSSDTLLYAMERFDHKRPETIEFRRACGK